MSYDPKIGVNTDVCRHFGVSQKRVDVSDHLPCKEPEPKFWLTCPNKFLHIRNIMESESFRDMMILPGTVWTGKAPLVSVLMDTRENGIPTMRFAKSGKCLRYRFELQADGTVIQQDFTEKGELSKAPRIKGILNRDEVEGAFPIGVDFRAGFEKLQNIGKEEGRNLLSHHIDYDTLFPSAGYIAARTTYNFVLKHPQHPVLLVFEACEDIMAVLSSSLTRRSAMEFPEFEFECKQVWGTLPASIAKDKTAFRNMILEGLSTMQQRILTQAHSFIESCENSKSEVAALHQADFFGNQDLDFTDFDLSVFFNDERYQGNCSTYTPQQFGVMTANPLGTTLAEARRELIGFGGQLSHNRDVYNRQSSSYHRDALYREQTPDLEYAA